MSVARPPRTGQRARRQPGDPGGPTVNLKTVTQLLATARFLVFHDLGGRRVHLDREGPWPWPVPCDGPECEKDLGHERLVHLTRHGADRLCDACWVARCLAFRAAASRGREAA